jgi:hypothetical protein
LVFVKANQAEMSLPAFVKTMCLNGEVKSRIDQKLILELAKSQPIWGG